jgi:hypothetical protein
LISKLQVRQRKVKSRIFVDSGQVSWKKANAIQRWLMQVTEAHSEIHEAVCAEVKKMSLLFPKYFPPSVFQFTKFCTVGGTGVVVDMTVIFLLADSATLALNVTMSKVLAAEAAMLNNFAWNSLARVPHVDWAESVRIESSRNRFGHLLELWNECLCKLESHRPN